jgi:glycosyltransferase involved in cell wall biosynthesis
LKVLFVIDALLVGGAEKSVLEMLPFFQNVEWVVCHIYPAADLKPDYESKGVRVISLNVVGKYQFGTALRLVRQTIQHEKPDIVHSALFRASLVCRLLQRRMSFVHIGSFVNDSYVKERYKSLSLVGGAKLFVVQMVDRVTARWCDHYISITETIKLTNSRYLKVPLNKITVIYRGRDVSKYDHIRPLIFEHGFTFLNVARLINRKGQLELIRAFAIVKRKYPSSKLVLAGGGPSYSTYKNEITKLKLGDSVELLGKRNDVPQLLERAHWFVMPSHFEGLGGAIIEAMLAARPVLASDIPVLSENIKSGFNGLTFKLGDVEDLAAKMEWALLHPEEGRRMGINGKKFAMDRFDITNVTAQYESLYQQFV